MKRMLLLIATNLAVVLLLSITASVLGVNKYLTSNGLNLGMLLMFAALMGFGGAFISLLMSKTMAKWSTGAQVITHPQNEVEQWLLATVARQAQIAGIGMPEVAIYEGEANAFATGASRDQALVAVSTGLMQSMTYEEIEAVLAHEVAHIANGDMVTMTLIQGVVNTFVIFIARVIAYFVDAALRRDGEENSGPGLAYMVTVIVCELLLGLLASIIVMYFSRQREYRADAGAAYILGSPQPMMHALARLGGIDTSHLPKELVASGIAGGGAWSDLFSSHPPIESRIQALTHLR